MISQRVIEGTGEDIAEFVQRRPQERFKLVLLESPSDRAPKWGGPDPETWNEVMAFIHSYKGKLPVLPMNAASTESLYD